MTEDRRVKIHSLAPGQQGCLHKVQVLPNVQLLNSVQKPEEGIPGLPGVQQTLPTPPLSSSIDLSRADYDRSQPLAWDLLWAPGLAAQSWDTPRHSGGVMVTPLWHQCNKTHPRLAQRGVTPALSLPWPYKMWTAGGCSNSRKLVGAGWSQGL